MSITATKLIPAEALAVLADGEVRDGVFFLPPGQLDRKLYESVNKVLDALGGKWVRSRKGHVFEGDAADRVAAAVATGSYSDPKALAFFPTPSWLATELVERADVRKGHLCLEPSAGRGAIALRMAAIVGVENVTCFEIDKGRCLDLGGLNLKHVVGDFMQAVPPMDVGVFDRIVMNPPFSVPGSPQADIDHVLHAMKFLSLGSTLVSVMSGSVLTRSNAKTRAFRDLIEEAGGTIDALPDDSFEESGTNVRTCCVVVSK